ncbi:MAG: exonuclease domain-containing protein [Patescibacteria group bacterium]
MDNKKKIIFFDTETTGNTENDYICQIAYKHNDEQFSAMYKPPVRIPPEASAVHHISNKMIADKVAFSASPEYSKIKNLFEDKNSVPVAHNAVFDLTMLAKENINPDKFICTLRVARALDPEGKIEKYNLQYLRYLLEIEIEAQAHDALGDVLVLEKLFERLKHKIIEQNKISEDEAIYEMIEISSHPSILRTFPFGKYVGKKVEEVLKTDRGYLEWLLAQKKQSEGMEEDWIYTLEHFLNK